MRTVTVLPVFLLLLACAGASLIVPPSALTASGTAADTITCEQPVVVKAGSEPSGNEAEHKWIDDHYPNHGSVSQSLHGLPGKPRLRFDVLRFRTSEGHQASVCFDITSFYGAWSVLPNQRLKLTARVD